MNDRITIVIFMAFLSLVIAFALPLSVGAKTVTVLVSALVGFMLIKLEGMLKTEENKKSQHSR